MRLLHLLALALLFFSTAEAAAPSPVELEVFVRESCPRCEDAKAFLAELRVTHPEVQVRYLDVGRDTAARERLAALAAEHSLPVVGVPAFHARGQLLVGFSGRETSGRQLLTLLEGGGGPGGAEGVCPLEDTSCPPPASTLPRDTVELPWVGRVSVGELGLPAFTVVLGLIDGFNPCAMWVLLFLLSLLIRLGDRRKMFVVGGTFVLTSGLVYFAFMAAWLNVFLLVGFSRLTQVLLGVVALGIGLLNVKDFFAFHRGPTLSIPERAKPGLYARTRRLLEQQPLLSAMGGVVVLALLVNLVELACTAGLPAVYTQVLALRRLPGWQYYAYLALYNAAYILDDSVMLVIAVVTLSQRKLQQKAGRWLKLLSGAVMLLLGLLLLVWPRALLF
ncbi:glutaredoxin domain-containing protein [Myxococcus sp. RHSTA-1-4]|uniref:glutaredoxin domain-containing protein n=1 Tax=Myxococcus sp. RHSTA-1-4 TaxID=2874601 RepID=UPI001CBF41AB|nr:glutaredoxin domain-containing protein [Myxococcus sp. RHSTA-1-4]MBZ4420230.1 NrdH-redoxin [Myxococcus sp. RHSTA-1-4]